MFGIGLPEMILLVVVALLLFDARKLPDLVRTLARGMMAFREATQEIRSSVEGEMRRIRREVNRGLPESDRDEDGQSKER